MQVLELWTLDYELNCEVGIKLRLQLQSSDSTFYVSTLCDIDATDVTVSRAHVVLPAGVNASIEGVHDAILHGESVRIRIPLF